MVQRRRLSLKKRRWKGKGIEKMATQETQLKKPMSEGIKVTRLASSSAACRLIAPGSVVEMVDKWGYTAMPPAAQLIRAHMIW